MAKISKRIRKEAKREGEKPAHEQREQTGGDRSVADYKRFAKRLAAKNPKGSRSSGY